MMNSAAEFGSTPPGPKPPQRPCVTIYGSPALCGRLSGSTSSGSLCGLIFAAPSGVRTARAKPAVRPPKLSDPLVSSRTHPPSRARAPSVALRCALRVESAPSINASVASAAANTFTCMANAPGLAAGERVANELHAVLHFLNRRRLTHVLVLDDRVNRVLLLLQQA